MNKYVKHSRKTLNVVKMNIDQTKYLRLNFLPDYLHILSISEKLDLSVRTFVKYIKLVLVECLLIRADRLKYMHVINTLLYCLAAYRECHFVQKVLKNEFCVVLCLNWLVFIFIYHSEC